MAKNGRRAELIATIEAIADEMEWKAPNADAMRRAPLLELRQIAENWTALRDALLG